MSFENRQELIGLVAEVISGMVVYEEGTPQNDAYNWLVYDDPDYLCPEDPTLVTRYTLVVFYYSTRGDRWTQCRAPSSGDIESEIAANDDCPGGNAWLTSGSECNWSGVTCDENFSVIRLDIGRFSASPKCVGDRTSECSLPIRCLSLQIQMV